MAANINLLPSQATEGDAQSQTHKALILGSTVVLAITIIAVLGLFVGKLVIESQLNDVNNNIKTQTAHIAEKKQVEGVYRNVTAKLTSLQTFFGKQKHYSAVLAALTATLPQSMRLTDLSMVTTNDATMTGDVSSYADLSGFFTKFKSAGPVATTATVATAPYFLHPMLVNITRNDQSGSITFTIKFSIAPTLLSSTGGAK
jgi:Tfp pilus assembly protein PilN